MSESEPAPLRQLFRAQTPVEFIRYPREGHPILERAHQIDLYERMVGWVNKYLFD